MHSPIRSILVGVGPGTDPRTLAAAVALAQHERAQLTVLAAVVKPSPMLFIAPIGLPYDPVRAAEHECVARLNAAVAAVPADLPVRALLRRDGARGALLAELRCGRHDLVIVGGGRRRHRSSAVARMLLRRGGAPVLVIDRARRAGNVQPVPGRDLVAQGA